MISIPRKASSLLQGTDVILNNGQKARLAQDVKELKIVGVFPYHVSGVVQRTSVPISPNFIREVFIKGGRNIEIIHE